VAEVNPQAKHALLNSLVSFLRDNKTLTILLDVIVAALYGFAGLLIVLNLFWAFVAFVVAVCLNVLARLRAGRHEQSVRELADQLLAAQTALAASKAETEVARESVRALQQEIQKTVETVLQRVAVNYGLGNKDRITLYLYSHGEGALRVIGRHSQDAAFKSTAPETLQARYEYTSGLVGVAARKEERLQRKDGPSFDVKPEEYREWQRQNFLEAEALPRMKSRCYDIIPLFDSSDHQQLLGVIALESIKTRSQQITAAGDALNNSSEPMTVGIMRESLRLYATAVLDAGREEEQK
jgi:hypothetical protein